MKCHALFNTNCLVFFVGGLIFLFTSSFRICLADDNTYSITYDYAYKAGYAGGEDEKARGYPYQPEVVLAQPIFQMMIKSMKQRLNLSRSAEKQFDQAFRDGFNDGFRDGYYGNPRKKTRFD